MTMTIEERWQDAFEVWLASKARRSTNTARAYRRAVDDLAAFVDKPFSEVGGADAQAWANEMAENGLADSTVNARLAACSSFWRFCMRAYTFPENGRIRPLTIVNPFDQVGRQRVELYGHSRSLSLEQAQALLGAPDRSTVRGARDYALLYFMLLTSRRNSEVRRLQWGSIQCRADGVWRYHWSGKGSSRWDDLPEPVLLAIRLYVQLAGRELEPADFVFCADGSDGRHPLTDRHVNRIVQGYLRQVGVDWGTAHTLRHTAAALRRASGEDLQAVSRLLAHSSLRVTQVYLEALEGARDDGWRAAAGLLAGAPQCFRQQQEDTASSEIQGAGAGRAGAENARAGGCRMSDSGNYQTSGRV